MKSKKSQVSMIESGSILALQSRLFPGGWRQVTVPGSMCHPTGSQSLVLRVHTGDSLGQVCSLASVQRQILRFSSNKRKQVVVSQTLILSANNLSIQFMGTRSPQKLSHIPAKLQMARIYERVDPEERSTQLVFNTLRYSLNLFLLLYLYKANLEVREESCTTKQNLTHIVRSKFLFGSTISTTTLSQSIVL